MYSYFLFVSQLRFGNVAYKSLSKEIQKYSLIIRSVMSDHVLSSESKYKNRIYQEEVVSYIFVLNAVKSFYIIGS